MKLLELFSGTHSIGKVASKKGYHVTSVDLELGDTDTHSDSKYKSEKHFKVDIMTWDYKKYFKEGDFDLITASPVCLWWSQLRRSNIGKLCKNGRWKGMIYTAELMDQDIIDFGIPMVDKIFEILDYFKPKYWWIENPKTGRMKTYINDCIPYIDFDYCSYGFEYKKSTRFWTNINIKGHLCNLKCGSIIEGTKRHIAMCDGSGVDSDQKGTNRYERYRIPEKLIIDLLEGVVSISN